MESIRTKEEREAEEYGIDLNLLFDNLSLSPEERIDQHQRALDIINELKRNFKKVNGISQKSSQGSR